MPKIADLIVSLTADVAQFNTSMQASAEHVKKLGESFESAKEKIKTALEVLAVAEVVKFARESADAANEWAQSIERLTSATGLSAQAAGALSVVAKEEGVSMDSVTGVFSKLAQVIATNPKKLQELGVAFRDARTGAMLPFVDIVGNLTKRLEDFKAGPDRAAAAFAVLGKKAGEALPNLLKLGPALNNENFARASEFIEGLGLTIGKDNIAKANEYEKAMADLGFVMLGVKNQIGSALQPAIVSLSEKISELVRDGSIKKWAEEGVEGLKSAVAAAKDLYGRVLEINAGLALGRGEAVEGLSIKPDIDGETVAQLTTGLENKLATATKLKQQIKEFETKNSLFAVSFAGGAEQDKLHETLNQTIFDIKEYQRAIDNLKSTAFTGPVKPPGLDIPVPKPEGTEQFNLLTDAQKAALEKFEKLRNELTAQKGLQEALSDAWKRGGVDVQNLTNQFNAYKASLALGKDNTDAQREAIRKLNLETAQGADQVKIDEALSKFSKTAGDAVAFQNRLTVAYNQGGFAVERLTDEQHAYNAALTLGLNATDAERKAAHDLDLAQSTATHDAQRAAQLLGVTDAINENIRAQNALAAAYNSGGRSIIAITDLEKAYQAELALGKNATDA